MLVDQPFWRDEPYTPGERGLLEELFRAHDASTYRQNVSSTMVVNACVGSGEYLKAIPAALLTLGGLHGPITLTYSLLESNHALALAQSILLRGQKVPGWGNSFVQGHDPIWEGVRSALCLNAPELSEKIVDITKLLASNDKSIYPNPACYTAAVAIKLGIPQSVSPWLFIQGRLGAWSKIAMKHL